MLSFLESRGLASPKKQVSRTFPPAWARFGAAVLAVALVCLLRQALWSVFATNMPFLFFWPAVLFVAWFGGLWPGILATILAVAAMAFFLFEPFYSLDVSDPGQLSALLIFFLMGMGFGVLECGVRRRFGFFGRKSS